MLAGKELGWYGHVIVEKCTTPNVLATIVLEDHEDGCMKLNQIRIRTSSQTSSNRKLSKINDGWTGFGKSVRVPAPNQHGVRPCTGSVRASPRGIPYTTYRWTGSHKLPQFGIFGFTYRPPIGILVSLKEKVVMTRDAQVLKQIEIPFEPEHLGNSVSIHFGVGVHMNTPLSLLCIEYIQFCIY